MARPRGWAHLGALGAPLEVRTAEMPLGICFLNTDPSSVMTNNSPPAQLMPVPKGHLLKPVP